MDILIDFDGTCVTHEFPAIGKDIGAVPVLKELVEAGHNLILFTMRSDIENPVSLNKEIILKGGKYLTEALQWFKDRDIPLYGINTNPDQLTWTTSPKPYAQILIDDTAIGCPLIYDCLGIEKPYVNWDDIHDILLSRGIIKTKKMQVSKLSISKIDYWETGGREYYEKFLQKFTWPGGASGITVGFGYDLGYYTSQEIINTWTGHVNGNIIALMLSVSGLKGEQAKKMINEQMRRAIIPYDVAAEIFLKTTLPDEARNTEKTYPGVTELFPDAQGALLSLIYNRGTQLEDEKSDRRKEMKAIAPLVLSKDYNGIAAQIISMKRLWSGKGMDGLIERRDGEAELVLNANHDYSPDEIVYI